MLDGTPGTARELDALLRDLEPTLPVLLGNAVSVNQVVVSHLAGIEQLLVTYPRTIATGFTGTPGDGYGHVNLQLDNAVAAVHGGLQAAQRVAAAERPHRRPDLPGPVHQRSAVRHARPEALARASGNPSPGRVYRSSYDPTTGFVSGAVDADGQPVRFVDQGNLSILGGDAWKWLLVGPVTSR